MLAVQYVEMKIPEYRIDERTVGCAEWKDCVASGACLPRPGDECDYRRATISWPSAAEYCAAHGGVLPTWAQWMRMARGDGRNVYLGADEPCNEPYRAKSEARGCARRTVMGGIVVVENPNLGEWTSDKECHHEKEVPLAVSLSGKDLGWFELSLPGAEFRCVELQATGGEAGR